MKIGTLVKLHNWLGVVVGFWTHEDSEEEHALVTWLTGGYTGETDAIWCQNKYLEVLCK